MNDYLWMMTVIAVIFGYLGVVSYYVTSFWTFVLALVVLYSSLVAYAFILSGDDQ